MHEGKTRLNGLAVSRSLGDHFAKDCGSGVIGDPYISECIKLQPSDTHLVIASDGVSVTCNCGY
jgi:serine/threonine protein phosphatase PrpC